MKRFLLWVLGCIVVLGFVLIAGIMATSTKSGPLPNAAAGYHEMQMPAPRRGGKMLTLSLWYPAQSTYSIQLIGQNALFYGFYGRTDAQADGRAHGLVVLSHGSGGNAQRLGWIASRLAEQGFVVAAVNHAGTTSRDSLPARTVQPWERAGDVSDIVDFLTDSPPLGLEIDERRIGVMGFSLGGATALVAGGARLSKRAFVEYCADFTGKDDCTWLRAGGVDFTAIDAKKYEADLRDARVRAVLAVDPALTRAMTDSSLHSMTLPVRIINLGAGDNVSSAAHAQDAAQSIPNATYAQIEGAAHFSFLARCSTFGAFIIGLAGDDNICSDKGLRRRDTIQHELEADIGAFFLSALR